LLIWDSHITPDCGAPARRALPPVSLVRHLVWYQREPPALPITPGRASATSLGAENLFNRKYFLFHPFAQRTIVGSLRYAF
jgi:hypothetical protein